MNLEEDLTETIDRMFHRRVDQEQLVAHQKVSELQDSFQEQVEEAQMLYPKRNPKEVEIAVGSLIASKVNEVHMELEIILSALEKLREFRLQALHDYIQDKEPVSLE